MRKKKGKKNKDKINKKEKEEGCVKGNLWRKKRGRK